MPNRRAARSTPKMIAGLLTYSIDTPLGKFYQTVKINSKDWFNWLRDYAKVFSYQAGGYAITLRGESRKGTDHKYWYAYKKIGKKLKTKYVGTSDQLTEAALQTAADYFRTLVSLPEGSASDPPSAPDLIAIDHPFEAAARDITNEAQTAQPAAKKSGKGKHSQPPE